MSSYLEYMNLAAARIHFKNYWNELRFLLDFIFHCLGYQNLKVKRESLILPSSCSRFWILNASYKEELILTFFFIKNHSFWHNKAMIFCSWAGTVSQERDVCFQHANISKTNGNRGYAYYWEKFFSYENKCLIWN